MTIYVYPAVFTYRDGYETVVTFPDFPGCVTCCGAGDARTWGVAMADLYLHIKGMLDDNELLPNPTPLDKITIAENERTVLVEVEI